MWLAGTGVRETWFADSRSHSTSSMPCATVFLVPPVSWMLKACSCAPVARLSCSSMPLIWFVSQPSPTTSTVGTWGWRA